MREPVLPESMLARVDADLADTDAALARTYPGDRPGRQPVHTVYVPADRYVAELPDQWGAEALALVAEHDGWWSLAEGIGLDPALADEVVPRVVAKLETEPIEDLRLDFEDGYGTRTEKAEDADAVTAARHLAAARGRGQAPAFVGIRFKCFEAATRRRGIRTLDLFLGTLLAELGALPPALRLTLPKVSTASQVAAMVSVCEALESAHGLADGTLTFEVQVETPPLILGPDGRVPVAEALHAGAGRVTGLHYGTYDYSASLSIAAEHQSAAHPAADFAKSIMQVAAAGTGVQLADGSTNVLPVGGQEDVRAAWRLHAGLVQRALERAYYQGWDLHPGQLPTRYLVTFAFFRRGLAPAARRLSDYLRRTGSGFLDEPATARALARYLQRGLACGAVSATECEAATGLPVAELEGLALPR